MGQVNIKIYIGVKASSHQIAFEEKMSDLVDLYKTGLTCYGSRDVFGQVNRRPGHISRRGGLVRRVYG